MMIFIVVLAGAVVLAVLLGVLADYRARRHGRRLGSWNKEAIQNRLDIDATRRGGGPVAQGRSQGWMTFRRRGQPPGK